MNQDPDTIPVAQAEAATEIGADYDDDALPEGAAIVTALVLLAAACALALIAAALGAAAAAFF